MLISIKDTVPVKSSDILSHSLEWKTLSKLLIGTVCVGKMHHVGTFVYNDGQYYVHKTIIFNGLQEIILKPYTSINHPHRCFQLFSN